MSYYQYRGGWMRQKSKYTHVEGYKHTKTNEERWYPTIKGLSRRTYYTPRDAAMAVDLFLIKNNKKPKNILIPKP